MRFNRRRPSPLAPDSDLILPVPKEVLLSVARLGLKLRSFTPCAISCGVSPSAVCGEVRVRPAGREIRIRLAATETTRSSV